MTDAEHDDDLLQRALTGDGDALERVLLQHYDRLSRRIARRLPSDVQSVASEEDILQQTFVIAFQDVADFKPAGERALYRWLCTIAENRLRDAIRAHRAAKRGGGRVVTEGADVHASFVGLIDVLAGPRRTPSRSAAGHEAEAAVRNALATIHDDARRALDLRYIRGLPVAEAAEVMGRSPRAIHNLCYRGLKELLSAMGGSTAWLSRS